MRLSSTFIFFFSPSTIIPVLSTKVLKAHDTFSAGAVRLSFADINRHILQIPTELEPLLGNFDDEGETLLQNFARSPVRDAQRGTDLAQSIHTFGLTQEQSGIMLQGAAERFKAEQIAAQKKAKSAGRQMAKARKQTVSAFKNWRDTFGSNARDPDYVKSKESDVTHQAGRHMRAVFMNSRKRVRENRVRKDSGRNIEHIGMVNKAMRKATRPVKPIPNPKRFIRRPTASRKRVN